MWLIFRFNLITSQHMKPQELAGVIRTFKQIRELSHEHLPVDHSFIPYDILMQVCASHSANERISVKGLFSKLPFSDMGIRYHFDRLVKEGWIELAPDQTDGRVKLAVPSERLLERVHALAESFKAYEVSIQPPAPGAQNFRTPVQSDSRSLET